MQIIKNQKESIQDFNKPFEDGGVTKNRHSLDYLTNIIFYHPVGSYFLKTKLHCFLFISLLPPFLFLTFSSHTLVWKLPTSSSSLRAQFDIYVLSLFYFKKIFFVGQIIGKGT